ncbi:MAG: HEAT repeat domain-containing protein [Planctomycetes bacterium]|nr:HEAT repeat domain-containing protein [Planctomycetota bacterium]
MQLTQRLLLASAAALLASAQLFPQAAPAGDDPAKLIETLKSPDASLFQKAKACQRLAVVGTKEAVPVLAGLLSDDKLAHYARYGLEPLPDPSVDDALRDALGKLKGKLLAGAINSIGVRRDSKAVDALAKLAADRDSDVVGAAASSLGKIGTPEAAAVLRRALADTAGAARTVVAQSCLVCAEGLAARGQREEAVALYDAVRGAELPPHLPAAATRGSIVARGRAGVPLLLETLEEGDAASFAVALGLARELPGTEVTRALVSKLGGLPPARRALVIGALGGRGDPAAAAAVLEAAKDALAEVRLAAIHALPGLGDAAAVPVLLEAAAGGDADAAQGAQSALEGMRGKAVDDAVAAALEKAEGRLRIVAIELAGRRGVRSAVPALRKAADEADDAVRLAAVRSLGMTVGLEDASFLIARFVSPRAPQVAAAAEEALRAAAKRLADKDGLAAKLLEVLGAAPRETKVRVLSLLGAVGGSKALKAVAAVARDADEGLRGAATDVLGAWSSEDAAPELLGLVKGSKHGAERTRALRGFSRVVSGLRFPKEQRLALCKDALDAARDDEERKLLLGTLAAVPAMETFPLLIPYLSSASLKDDASAAVLTIAERIVRYQQAAVREPVKHALAATSREDLVRRAKRVLEQAGGGQ